MNQRHMWQLKLKTLRRKHGGKPSWPWFGKGFSDMTQKIWTTKEKKPDELNFTKIKNVLQRT